MRIAFTIILNGLHHLKHNDYYKTMLDNFDYWVVVEGASKSVGSTLWCKQMKDKYHNNGSSVDGTIEFLEDLSLRNKKLKFVKSKGFWNGKDEQVNVAINEVRKITDKCFLWQVDIDEQWELSEIEKAERELVEKGGKTGLFKCEYYVGSDLIVKGVWGEGPYNRLWNWNNESFQAHEPPILSGGNGKEVLLSSRFKHYSYFFQKDVEFKNDWYSGHENVLDNWLNLKNETNFPIHVSKLITGPWGKTNSFIYKNPNKKKINVDKVYVCHWSSLIDRKNYINERLNSLGIEHEFVELYDTSNWNVDEISKKYKLIFSFNPRQTEKKYPVISLALKHCWIVEDAIKNNYESIMILEDDAEFVDDFVDKFNSYYKQLPKDWDMCFVGSCCNLFSKNIESNVFVYPASSSRCTHCYIISKSGLNKIRDEMYNVNDAIDWYYNHLINKIPLNNYWMEPPLSFQSSEFKSSLRK